MTTGLYSIQNTVNGKEYIGSSQNIELRWKQHRNSLRKGKHHSDHLQRAWELDGEDAFLFVIQVECEIGELLDMEQRLMNARKSANGDYGYNVSAVAGSRRGVPHSEEVRAKMREAAKSRPERTEESKLAQSELVKQLVAERGFSEEHRRKISEGLTGRFVSEETRAKFRANNLGKVISEETKAKLSLANKGKKMSEENYAKLMERSKTTNLITPEIRAKQSASRTITLAKDRADVAEIIVPLRQSGLTYKQIANKLTEDRVPTLRSRRSLAELCFKWHAAIVRAVCLEFELTE